MENNNFEQQTNEQQFTDYNVNPEPQYQQPSYQQPQFYQPPVVDKKSTGLNILSFFFPIVGLILYLVFKDQTPIKAKGCGKAALIAVILYVIFMIVCFAISFMGAMAVMQ